VKIRRATEADEAAIGLLWAEFTSEVPEPPGFPTEPWEDELAELRKDMAGGAVYVAEQDGEVVGIAQVAAPASASLRTRSNQRVRGSSSHATTSSSFERKCR
jgi:hypothetical protein